MGLKIDTQVQGLDETLKGLEQFKGAVQRRILRPAIRQGATLILKAARRLAPVETGTLKKSMGSKIVSKGKQPRVVAIIGPRTGMGQEVTLSDGTSDYRDPARYGHLAEETSPFLRPAVDETREAVGAKVRTVMAEGIAKAGAKG
jgi:HK97 gp10 family phage protein